MTMISEYAGYSRATTHKYFKNKDDVFRQVIHQYQQQANQDCQPILTKNHECWMTINLIMNVWLKPTFSEVSDLYILNDLKYHIQHIAEDIFKQVRQDIENMLSDILKKAIDEKKISLANLALNEQRIAKLLLASLDGLKNHLEQHEIEQAIQDIIKIFQLSCR